MNKSDNNIQMVMNLIEEIKRKLNLTDSIEDIIKKTNQEGYKYARLNKRIFYPWEDVLSSMYKYPEKVTTVNDQKCPHCGGQLIKLYFMSPGWTWSELCGRGGDMTICPNCIEQISFNLTIMN